MLIAVIALVVGILIGASLATTSLEIRHLKERLLQIEARRHTHSTCAGIEDAQAVNFDLVRSVGELEIQLSVLKQRAAQQATILSIVRQGPHSYDPDRPAGKRPDGKKGNKYEQQN